MKPRPYAGTQAVQRALRLLKAFTAAQVELGLTELAREVGLNKTTAFRLLTALESAELIERGKEGHAYRLGPELLRLAAATLGTSGLQTAARATLRALADSTRETATLELLVGDDVLILDEVAGDHVVGVMPSLGTRWPSYATSTGKVMLADLGDEELQRRLPHRLKAFTERTVTNHAALRRELARVRARGYATAVEELEPGFVAIGAPVRSAGGAVLAAISVGGPKSRLGPAFVAEIAKRLPRAADAISERLGWQRSPVEPGTRRSRRTVS
jgi:IclR family transcriptional regulator, acetate operon repressor